MALSEVFCLFSVAILVLQADLTLAQCPVLLAPCICESTRYEPIVIQCANSGSVANTVRSIQNAKNVLIDSLIIKYTAIPKLPADSFKDFRIKRLVLNKNQMTEIDDNAFSGLISDSLTELDLKDNKLRGIPTTGITKLKNLKKLYLSKNGIRTLPANAFSTYESRKLIQKLDLSNNLLQDSGLIGPLGRSSLTDLTSLTELSLESNSLTTLSSGLLAQQRVTLQNLNLGSNEIVTISSDQLNFPNLESLSFEYCRIQSLSSTAFRNIRKLRYLYLTGNRFSEWPTEMFRYIGNLEVLSIGETPIRSIPSAAFSSIPRLTEFKMTESAVIEVQRGAFQRIPNVKAISLSKNNIKSITTDTFQGLNQLSTLDLYSNSIDSVSDFSFANLPALRHLDLSFNNISVLSSGTFQNTFTSSDSRTVYLCGNPWACDNQIDWLRTWLQNNPDVIIDKPGTPQCQAQCAITPDWVAPNWPLRDPDPPRPQRLPTRTPDTNSTLAPLPTPGREIRTSTRVAGLSTTVWIILGIILGILLLAILLLLLVRYFISRRRKKDKEEEELRRILNSSTSSGYQVTSLPRSHFSTGIDLSTDTVDLNLPRASTLEVKDHYIGY